MPRSKRAFSLMIDFVGVLYELTDVSKLKLLPVLEVLLL